MSVISKSDDQTFIRDFNATDDVSLLGKRLDQLFEDIVDEYPSSIALIHAETQISYQELNVSANRLARGLAKRGVNCGDIIGLSVERSINLVVGIFAVLKLGAAYVPIDSAFPEERISHMIEDARPKLVLTSGNPSGGLLRWQELCLSVDEVQRSSTNEDVTNLRVEILPRDLAYVIYTSGSTGRPKGVEISHGAASNFLASLRRHEPGCNSYDTLLAVTTISFDMSALELLLPPLSGATMVISHPDSVREPRELLRMMKQNTVTIMQATPATWTMLLECGSWGNEIRLSKIICGGEALTRRLADRLLTRADSVWNVYGPSETTYGSVGRVSSDGEIFVGNPVANGRIYVLGEKMSAVPMGHSGEVYIGGGSVSNGYRNKPELTHARFLKNPFHDGLFFRTGDMARFVAPGKLQVLGRIDGMVKIRGFRIELGDIEAAILENEAISEATVISRDNRLIAYCVPNAVSALHFAPKELVGRLLSSQLREWLASRLPEYMMPAFFVAMETLPLSPNQKIDRKALPDPVMDIEVNSRENPSTKMERQVWAIWTKILGHDRIGIEDSFFQIGGDSLRLIRVQSQLEALVGQHVSVPVLFEHFTIKSLALYLESQRNGNSENLALGSVIETSAEQHGDEIAIVSMACRLPGGVSNPGGFWGVLEREIDATVDVPKDRWDAEQIYDADPDATGKSYCRRGGFLSSVNQYDISFFGLSPREAQAIHPAQYTALEVGWETFERAGYTKKKLVGSETGVFIGLSDNVTTAQASPDLNGYSITGSATAVIAGRISYILGLNGPSMTVDTACSSSLVATHLACNALRLGDCDLALAGGVSLLLTPGIHVEFSRLRGLSPDGRCRAFSADTEGTGFSEGCSMILLKRLTDAQRDGDIIHAVVRGSGVSHGGRSVGLTAPNGASQARLIRKVLRNSALQASDIDYIEAHGTATRLGDPIEGGALADVFRGSHSEEEPLWIGSSKSNLGHTGAAAGVTGVIKVILALQHNTLPRTLHATEPTKEVDWKGAGMSLVQQKQPWRSSTARIRRAGVSSYGIGGTGAHAILEEAPKSDDEPEQGISLPSCMIFLLSGQTNAALQQQARNLKQHISSLTGKLHLHDLAYSLSVTRDHFQFRLALKARDKDELVVQLASVGERHTFATHHYQKGRVAFLFSGQGSQVQGMGKMLYRIYPVFRKSLERVVSYFSGLSASLIDVMWADSSSDISHLLDRTDFAQPALFSLQVALWELWQSWGVKVHAVLGHSVGEIAAAFAAGIFDLKSACILVEARSRLMQALPKNGGMMALEVDAFETATTIKLLGIHELVFIAAYNTPTQTVVSGDIKALDELAAYSIASGRKVKRLNSSHAFHSPFMRTMLTDFQEVVDTIRFQPSNLVVVGGRTGKVTGVEELQSSSYWVHHVVDAVRFQDGINSLVDFGVNAFVDIGAQPVLCALGASCLAENRVTEALTWLPSLVPGREDATVIQSSLSELHIRNVAVDWHAYHQPFQCRQMPLPTYPFQRTDIIPSSNGNKNEFEKLNPTPPLTPEPKWQRCDKIEFELRWHSVRTKPGQTPKSWGVLCSNGNITPWVFDLRLALSQTDIELRQIAHIEDAQSLDGLICIWDSDADADILSQVNGMTASALAILKVVAMLRFPATLVWVTHQAVGTEEGDGDMNVAASPLWGLLRTARTENPDLRLRLIDIGEGQSNADMLAQALALEGEPECAIRNSEIFVPRMKRRGIPSGPNLAAQHNYLRQDGAVLITGGLGDIGQNVARHLINAHGITDLVLVSRRGLQAPGAQAIVAELTELGAQVIVIAADMSKEDNVAAIIQMFSSNRPLRGIVHAAGVLDDGVLSSVTLESCRNVYGPKVSAAWHLHLATENMDLDFFIMCSSLSGIIGNAGQASYAAANTFLDALAHMRHTVKLPATSVSFGLWGGKGINARLSEFDQARYAESGIGALNPNDGLDLLMRLVLCNHPHTVVVAYDLEKLQTHYSSSGEVPVLFHSLLYQQSSPKEHGVHLDLRTKISASDRKDLDVIMLDVVRQELATVLGFSTKTDIDIDQPLKEIGIDSLTAILARNRLAALTGLSLPAKTVFDYPNVRILSRFLLEKVQETLMPTTHGDAERILPIDKKSDWAMLDRGFLDPTFTFKTTLSTKHPPLAVFITGGTGFVGAFIVGYLLNMGIFVHCLVRDDSSRNARRRLIKILSNYELWSSEYEQSLVAIAGDVALPCFGMSEEAFDKLSTIVDTICHSAALVDWMLPLEQYVGPNVTGTSEILRLASSGRSKVVHHISTVAVLPRYLGTPISEKQAEYGYCTSKWVAEQMIMAARWRGANASIYRLPYVAAACSGQFRRDRGDFLHNLVSGCIEIGKFPSIKTDLSLVLPVDYLAKSIVAVMTKDLSLIGQDFTFGNTTNALAFDQYFQMMSRSGQEILSFREWRHQALDYAASHPTSALARIAAVLDDCASSEDVASLFRCPEMGQNMLSCDAFPVPLMDQKYVQNYLNQIQLLNVVQASA